MKTEVITFIQDITPGQNLILKERLKDNGQVVELRIRFYPGVEKALQVHPYVLHTGNRAEELMTFSGLDKVLTGDNDYFVFPVNVGFIIDDEFAVNVVNSDTVNTYTLVLFAVVNYDPDYLG